MRRHLLSFISCLLLLTACSRKMVNDKVNYVQNRKAEIVERPILVTTPDGCVKTVHHFNGNNKITEVYEYIYQY
jgi:hypothetical protein